jgi:alpha-beta hydrolase superfamily lysophospholipase
MLALNSDPGFSFELLRMLATATGGGSDVAEVLNVCERINDFESWYHEFDNLANWVESTIQPKRGHAYDRITLRNAYFRIARYRFASSFYLTGDASDQRNWSTWKEWTSYFDRAGDTFDIPPQRHTIISGDLSIPCIVLRCTTDNVPRPCLIMGNGLDGSQEEMFHVHGFAALERGYHVVLYEGPGQTSVIRDQHQGFIPDWERVVTPLVDWLFTLPFIKQDSVGLLGLSLGGYLAARAAAFEHRLAAVILNDGIYDVSVSIKSIFGPEVVKHDGDIHAFNTALDAHCKGNTTATWLRNQIKWAWNAATPYDAFQASKKMTLEGLMDKVRCPVLVCDAEHDSLVTSDQPPQVAKALGKMATYRKFTRKESADAHCHLGATIFANQVMLEWFRDQLPTST